MPERPSIRVHGDRSATESLILAQAATQARGEYPTATDFTVDGYTADYGPNGGYFRVSFNV